MDLNKLYRVSDYEWSIPKQEGMRVDAIILGSQSIVEEMDETVYTQLKNVASIPGVLEKVIVQPDAYGGYGFPVGGVAAFDYSNGLVIPSAVGYDINCGVRMISTNLIYQDIEKKVETLLKEMSKNIPAGSLEKGKVHLTKKEMLEILENGVQWLIDNKDVGKKDDADYIEEGGRVGGAEPDILDADLIKLAKSQLGTIGGGNHYLELQIVDEIFDIERARVFGLFKNQVVVTVHTGSRDFGHQIAALYQQKIVRASKKYGLDSLGENLAAVPVGSPEGREYLGAMRCAVNYAFANRQVVYHYVDKVLNDVIKDVETNVTYDLGHNTLYEENQKIGASVKKSLIYRNGSSRNFPGRMMQDSKPYLVTGHPVIVGGSMGASTYVLSGTEDSMLKTFGSSVHGAGRRMSPQKARETVNYQEMIDSLRAQKVFVKSRNPETVVEEAPEAYKSIDEVIKSINKPNISIRVARLKPIGVLKG